MSSRHVYIGHLSTRASEKDVERFFRGYGKMRDVVLKNGFGFVEFEDKRDAEDAIYELNGKDLAGERVVLEYSRRAPPPADLRGRFAPRGGFERGGIHGGDRRVSRFFVDLKSLMREHGEVTFADAHRKGPREALVCFANRDGLVRAMGKMQGKEVNGRVLKLIDDSDKEKRNSSRSHSRSHSRGARSKSANSSLEERSPSPK